MMLMGEGGALGGGPITPPTLMEVPPGRGGAIRATPAAPALAPLTLVRGRRGAPPPGFLPPLPPRPPASTMRPPSSQAAACASPPVLAAAAAASTACSTPAPERVRRGPWVMVDVGGAEEAASIRDTSSHILGVKGGQHEGDKHAALHASTSSAVCKLASCDNSYTGSTCCCCSSTHQGYSVLPCLTHRSYSPPTSVPTAATRGSRECRSCRCRRSRRSQVSVWQNRVGGCHCSAAALLVSSFKMSCQQDY
jgi:hypothetical protein